MNFSIEDVRKALDAVPLIISPSRIVASGVLAGDKSGVNYIVYSGWDLQIAHLCDRTWGTFNTSLLRHIRDLELQNVDISTILESAQLEDHHWRWLDKTMCFRGDSYKWFFLIAEDYPQAACLIYHPKSSVVGAGDIFYIEYIAAAPWNRENVLESRVFKGVGKILLSHVISYATDTLKLGSGFSLHSLPKAVQFYEKIGMKAFQEYDKDGLRFFEWVSPQLQKED